MADEPLRSDRVDVAIVFAVDRASLQDSDAVQMVRDGHITALRSLHGVMTSGPNGCVAVTYREWADEQRVEVVLPWSQICNEMDAVAAARSIALYRYDGAETGTARGERSFSGSVDMALAELKAKPWGANRRMVTVSTGDERIIDIIRPAAAITNIIAVQSDLAGIGGDVIAKAASSPDYIAAIERTLMLDVGGDRAFYMRPEEQAIQTARSEVRP